MNPEQSLESADGAYGSIDENACLRLAFEDRDFLASEELRAVRLQLEFMKPERALRQEGIASTIVVFGSARLLP